MADNRNNTDSLTIGRLSALAQVGADTVRFYERSGLLKAEERTQAGYRLYSANSLARVQFICRAREIGYSVDQIRQILNLHDHGGSKEEVEKFTAGMIAAIDEKIGALTKWRDMFADVADYFAYSEAENIDHKTVDTLMRGQCTKPPH